MAIQLYKEGNTHTVRGIECEVSNFHIDDLDLMLSEGWAKDPSELYKSAPTKPVEETLSETDTNIHPIRLAAKKAGIDGWDKRRIKTLEAELE